MKISVNLFPRLHLPQGQAVLKSKFSVDFRGNPDNNTSNGGLLACRDKGSKNGSKGIREALHGRSFKPFDISCWISCKYKTPEEGESDCGDLSQKNLGIIKHGLFLGRKTLSGFIWKPHKE